MSGAYTYQSPGGTFTVSQNELSEFSKRFPETSEFREFPPRIFRGAKGEQRIDPDGRQISPESTTKAVFNHAKAEWLHN
jgi:hypothetical protein